MSTTDGASFKEETVLVRPQPDSEALASEPPKGWFIPLYTSNASFKNCSSNNRILISGMCFHPMPLGTCVFSIAC